MQVILREDIPELGGAGVVVTVRDGYARNYLLPRKLAVRADAGSLKLLAQQQQGIAARQAKLKAEAQAMAGTLSAANLRFVRDVGEEGKLFGSVTAKDIIEALAAQGITLDRRRLKLHAPIKALGTVAVPVRLHSEVDTAVNVTVETTVALQS